MAQLKIGESIEVSANDAPSPVYMFSHQYPEAVGEFVKITTAAGLVIHLTAGHYLYVNGQLAQSRMVKVGDKLETSTGAFTAVVSIKLVTLLGLYNPHTMHGDIVVDGIRTSTYTDAINPVLAHSILAPVRAMYALGMPIVAEAVASVLTEN